MNPSVHLALHHARVDAAERAAAHRPARSRFPAREVVAAWFREALRRPAQRSEQPDPVLDLRAA
ncbi:hypothetical protein [Salsipaludibacter albus]|uniref:hypothetical protein n=1 Tax=Salsipaludibacter albus TaxID=2849650 RepID=UPI001EE4D16F|nr:hypothetical protein [Salsipaludibacter albus]MBY5163463.1 hypothetical protein [Salsipaludibacter albus]